MAATADARAETAVIKASAEAATAKSEAATAVATTLAEAAIAAAAVATAKSDGLVGIVHVTLGAHLENTSVQILKSLLGLEHPYSVAGFLQNGAFVAYAGLTERSRDIDVFAEEVISHILERNMSIHLAPAELGLAVKSLNIFLASPAAAEAVSPLAAASALRARATVRDYELAKRAQQIADDPEPAMTPAEGVQLRAAREAAAFWLTLYAGGPAGRGQGRGRWR